LKSLADAGLGAASVLANLHHRRIVPILERELRIYEMGEMADPVALARSQLVHGPLPQEYAATRARRAINFRTVRHSNDDLWSFVMLPNGPPVSGLSFPFPLFIRNALAWFDISLIPHRWWPWTPRSPIRPRPEPERARGATAGAGASGAQEREKDLAAGAL
jgi:hypothetical protein